MGFYSARVEPKTLDVHLEGRGCLGSSRMNILLRNANFPGDGEDKLDSGKCVKKYQICCEMHIWLVRDHKDVASGGEESDVRDRPFGMKG